nr:hypothetical protein [Tanacetum cinerariifolium]
GGGGGGRDDGGRRLDGGCRWLGWRPAADGMMVAAEMRWCTMDGIQSVDNVPLKVGSMVKASDIDVASVLAMGFPSYRSKQENKMRRWKNCRERKQ